MRRQRLEGVLSTALVAAVTALPFLRGWLSGASLYFRDLSMQFLPLRRFALEGLARGELRLWNPYVHEGVPLSLPSLGYPLDLLQLLRPDAYGISLVLALHVPLGASLFLLLARRLGLAPVAAVGGALAYGLGGFMLSTLNLYVYVQAAAWAPLIVLGFVRVASRAQRRDVALAAVALALGLSTTGIEIVAQALVIGCALGWPRLREAARRLAPLVASVALGAALAAPALLLVAGLVAGSARGRGFATEVVLAHSVHPLSLLQLVVANLHGDLADVVNRWWGQNFFPRGFPYVLSLYLGAATLALAIVGATSRHPLGRRLAALVLAGVAVALGRWAGLAPVVDALPPLHLIRYPVKAFFTAHLALALLVTLGLGALAGDDSRRAWRRLAAVAGGLGLLLVLAPALPSLAPAPMQAFSQGFFPPEFTARARASSLARVLVDAASGGILALVVASVALSVRRGWLGPARGVALAVSVVCADLLRAGVGLNPMLAPSFLQPSAELTRLLPRLREGRLFSCELSESPAYGAARLARQGRHEQWSFASAIELLTPFANVPLGISTALSPDLTMLVPEDRVPSPDESSCRHLEPTLARLQRIGVRWVLSLDPLHHPRLEPAGSYGGVRIAPLQVHVYRLAGARAFAEVLSDPAAPGRVLSLRRSPDLIALEVESAAPGRLVVREAFAPAWQASVGGRAAGVERVEGHYMAVPLPAGRARVRLRYRPPQLPFALAASALALGLVVWLAAAARAATGPPPA